MRSDVSSMTTASSPRRPRSPAAARSALSMRRRRSTPPSRSGDRVPGSRSSRRPQGRSGRAECRRLRRTQREDTACTRRRTARRVAKARE
jgi:hypothetical protein